MIRLSEYILNKYKLKSELGIDLKIHSDNVSEEIIVSPVDDKIIIKYDDMEIISDKRMIYKDISFLLDHLMYVFFISSNNDILHQLTYDGQGELTMIDMAEDFIWKNHDEMNIDKIFVVSFAKDYSFEASVSGSFVDTYWPIFDEAHYKVVESAAQRFKYKNKENYVTRYKSLLTNIIPSNYNLEFLRKYFLDTGFAFLLDYRDEDFKDVYQMIDIDFDNCRNIAGDKYILMSSDYESIIAYEDGRYFIKGRIVEEYPVIEKTLQVDKEPCRFIHSLKTSRVLYNGQLYEASGKNVSDCLNKLNKMLDGKILCCFTCKYGSYTTDERNIYCMHGFSPRDFADILYMTDESKMIPYDQFNLCEMYEIPTKDFYQHTLYKAVDTDE